MSKKSVFPSKHIPPKQKEKMSFPMNDRMEILRIEPDHTEIDKKFGTHIGVHECDAVRLAWLASQVPDGGTIVEIGSFWGRSTGYMAAACKDRDISIIAIDFWPNIEDFTKFLRNMKMLEYHFVQAVRMYSVEACAKLFHDKDESIDLLFIDGDHSFKGVENDYVNWFPKVKSGGTIAFHDYAAYAWGEVQFFVDSVAQCDLDITGVYQRVWSGRKK